MKQQRAARRGLRKADGGATAPPSAPRRDPAGLRARLAALEILLRVERERAYADVLLGHRLSTFAPVDRRLVTQLVLGTIAWQGRLDYELARLTARKLTALAPELLVLLRMGLYQMRMLTRIPHHAAVDTAVNLARELGGEAARAGGMVNAVLRRGARETVPMPDRDADELEYLSVAYSHPRWLAAKFVEWFGGAGAEALMAANNDAAPNAVRLNLARGAAPALLERLRAEGFEIAAHGPLAETVILKGAIRFESDAYRDGIFTPQSEASQMVARMLAPGAGAIVADCAAAPGGKTAHLAELVGDSGRIIAIDLNFAGLKNTRALAKRLGRRHIECVRADTAAALPLRSGSCDYVLLDAPCTGSGTLREHPEIRWRLEEADFVRMARLQRRMLENAAALVRRNGALVYAVCSLAPAEGPELVRAFLADHPQFRCDSAPPLAAEIKDAFASDGTMRTRPDRGSHDGFFAARLLRVA